MNDLTGHNKPPGMTSTAALTTADISAWLGEHPVITDETMAKEAKIFIDRGALCIGDLEDERKVKTDPLNIELRRINNYYKGPRDLLQRVVEELKHRIAKFIRSEEIRRAEIAREAAERAQESERVARLAERRETEALVEVDSGVLGIDIAAVSHDAETTFKEAKKAKRQAQIAAKDAHVKVTGGFRPAASLREYERLVVENAVELLNDCGLTHDIEEAMLKTARTFKKIHNRYPRGIKVYTERKI